MVQLLLILGACGSWIDLGAPEPDERLVAARPHRADTDTGGGEDSGGEDTAPVDTADTADTAQDTSEPIDTAGDTAGDTSAPDTADTAEPADDTAAPIDTADTACAVPAFSSWFTSDLWIGIDEPQSFTLDGCGTVVAASCSDSAIVVTVTGSALPVVVTFEGASAAWATCAITLEGETGATTTWRVGVTAR